MHTILETNFQIPSTVEACRIQFYNDKWKMRRQTESQMVCIKLITLVFAPLGFNFLQIIDSDLVGSNENQSVWLYLIMDNHY